MIERNKNPLVYLCLLQGRDDGCGHDEVWDEL